MSSRDKDIDLMKRGLNPVTEVSDEDLMNPDSEHFIPDWWLRCQILEDPWASIVSDFQWSDMIISDAEDRLSEYADRPVGHFPDSDSPRERMEFALNAIYKTAHDIEDKISYKTVDAEFVWKWGEYQKAVAMLMGALPEYDRHQSINGASRERSNSKSLARQWYVLWYEWYKKDRAPKRVSRTLFNEYFSKFLNQLRSEKREILGNKNQVLELVESFASNPEDREHLELTAFFTVKFFGKSVARSLEEANKNKHLPPVGEENYPLLK